MTTIHQYATSLTATRITTTEQGSWKWQQPYRISHYCGRILDDGRALWQSYSRSGKYSLPQLRGRGLQHGSLHNQPIARTTAVEQLGERIVSKLERKGVRFHGIKPDTSPCQWEIEVTDTFGGEANYCWVRHYLVTAKSPRGAITKLAKSGEYVGWCIKYDCGYMQRYNLQGACICAFVTWAGSANDYTGWAKL